MDDSDYTDADESVSAPTELLAEFLTAVMVKNYDNALKYCQMILTYEPGNATAKEFYPLIVEKLKMIQHEKDNDSNASDSTASSLSSKKSLSYDNKSSDSDRTSASYSSLDEDEDISDSDESGVASQDCRNGNVESAISTNTPTSVIENVTSNGN